MSVTRREFLYVSTVAAFVPARSLLFGQAPAAPPQTRFEAIRGSVGIFSGRGGTIGWLSSKDAVVVVDSQYPDTAKTCLDGLKERSGRGVDILINTHHHGDHTGGNAVFRNEVKKIVGHARVPALLQRPAGSAADAPPPTPPDTTFEKTWTESLGGERVTAKHYGPGHTGGDCIVHFQHANVVHMGDLLFNERHPYIDRPAGASIRNWITTVETIAKEFSADTVYIAGHARQGLPVIVDRAVLLGQRDYLDAVLTHAQRGIKENKPKEEIVKLQAIPGFERYEPTGTRLTPGAALGVAYDELTDAQQTSQPR